MALTTRRQRADTHGSRVATAANVLACVRARLCVLTQSERVSGCVREREPHRQLRATCALQPCELVLTASWAQRPLGAASASQIHQEAALRFKCRNGTRSERRACLSTSCSRTGGSRYEVCPCVFTKSKLAFPKNSISLNSNDKMSLKHTNMYKCNYCVIKCKDDHKTWLSRYLRVTSLTPWPLLAAHYHCSWKNISKKKNAEKHEKQASKTL